MSALSIRNMNWTIGQMEIIRESQVSEKANVMATCEKIANALTPDQYLAWLETTSNDNTIFTAQADAMLEQVAMAQELADSVTLNWTAAFLILDMCEGTEASPIISVGEILQPEYAEANAFADAFNFNSVQEIPF